MSAALPTKLKRLLETLSESDLEQFGKQILDNRATTQLNFGQSKGYQVHVDEGGTAYIGDQFQVDVTTLYQALQTLTRQESKRSIRHQKNTNFFRNRKRLISLVENFWIVNFLKQSLYKNVLLDPAIEVRREEQHSQLWQMLDRREQQPNEILPEGTDLNQLFLEVNQSLLILGEAGSGKTIALVRLAQDALYRAKKDIDEPIPIILNLASWNEHHRDIKAWIISELETKYNIPNDIAKDWVESDELIFFFDGLDTVDSFHQEDCVVAINQFLSQHWVNLAICCRVNVYDIFEQKLNVQGTVVIQPLSEEQTQSFIVETGLVTSRLVKDLECSSVLRELGRSPLMLHIMAVAYNQVSEDINLDNIDSKNIHHYFIDVYIKTMLVQQQNNPYSPQQLMSWLSWTAHYLQSRKQVEFLLSDIQPNCLDKKNKIFCDFLVVFIASFFFLLLGFLCGNILGLIIPRILPEYTFLYVFQLCLFICIVFALIYFISGITRIYLNQWKTTYLAIFLGLLYGIVTFSIVNPNSIEKVVGFLLLEVIFFLPSIYSAVTAIKINPLYRISSISLSPKRLFFGCLVGFIVSSIISCFILLGNDPRKTPDLLLLITLVIPSFSFIAGVQKKTLVPSARYANETVTKAIKFDILMFCLFFLCAGALHIVWGFIRYSDSAVTERIVYSLISEIPWAASVGLCLALGIGGKYVIQHCVIRFLLAINNDMPWNQSKFLEFATKSYFLKRLGGSYIFTHDLFLEFFGKETVKNHNLIQ